VKSASRRDWLIGFLLAALTLGVYWPVRNHGFIFYDDPQFITENPQVRSGLSWKTVVYAFTRPVAGNWHPITTLSHALDCELFGPDAGAHHPVNAGLHALNAALFFFVLQRLSRKCQLRVDTGWSSPKSETRNPKADPPRSRDSAARRNPKSEIRNSAWPSFLAAAVFALHPLRVESVAWIAERKDVLSGFFFLATLYLYGLFAERKTQRSEPRMGADGGGLREATESGSECGPASKTSSAATAEMTRLSETCEVSNPRLAVLLSLVRSPRVFYTLALLSFALGLMSKPMLVTLPFVLLLVDYWPLGRFEISDFTSRLSNLKWLIYEKVSFFLLALVVSWVTLEVQKTAGAMQFFQGIPLTERLSNAVTSYVRYLGKMFWPTDLAILYPHPARHYLLIDAWPAWEAALGGLLLVMISVLCLRELSRRPYLAVGWFWFLGTLVPVIGLVQVGEQAMADRYTYIPMIGPTVALVWWVSDLSAECGVRSAEWLASGIVSVRVLRIGAGAAIAVLACLTRHQLGYWENTVTLFEHAIAVTADNPSAQFAVGVGLEEEGQASKAMVRYRVAVAIDPHYAKAYYNMGQILRKAGNWQKAADAFMAAARCNPSDVPTQLNLANVLSHLGRTSEAIAHYERALELDANSTEALNNLAWLLSTCSDARLRDGARAVQLGEQACELTGFKVPVFLGTLAAAYAEAGRFTEAVTTAHSASILATEAGDVATATANRKLIELYQANKPYRDAQ
jgi:Tfp pilus assembly protein PilF